MDTYIYVFIYIYTYTKCLKQVEMKETRDGLNNNYFRKVHFLEAIMEKSITCPKIHKNKGQSTSTIFTVWGHSPASSFLLI